MTMRAFFIADLHLGHKNILKFTQGLRAGNTIEEHNEWIVSQINSVVKKKDQLYILGDVAFGAENLEYLKRINGQKFLILGNHDRGEIDIYKPYFQNIYGMKKFRGFWLTHAPMHPMGTRKLFNIHGHSHQHLVKDPDGNIDPQYINVCVEILNGVPLSFEQLVEIREKRIKEKALTGLAKWWYKLLRKDELEELEDVMTGAKN